MRQTRALPVHFPAKTLIAAFSHQPSASSLQIAPFTLAASQRKLTTFTPAKNRLKAGS
jgi:hypothetical protein